MISLQNYIYHKITESFSVAGKTSNKILLFDVDDTLIKSDVKVYVMKDDKIIKKLSSTEFNTYKLNPGESFDYREFEDERILNKSKFLKYWDTLKREYSEGTHIGIITARANKDMFYKFFKSKGFTIKNELVFAINDPNIDLDGDTIEERKTNAIEKIIDYGYKTIIFFDDNENNLNMVKKLERKYDIKIHTIKA